MSVEARPQSAVPSRGKRFFDALDERLGVRGLAYPVPEHANKLAYSLGGLSLAAFLPPASPSRSSTIRSPSRPTPAFAGSSPT